MPPASTRTSEPPAWPRLLAGLMASLALVEPAAAEVFIGYLPGRTVTDLELVGETVWAVADAQLFRWEEEGQDFRPVEFGVGQVGQIEKVPEGLLVAYGEQLAVLDLSSSPPKPRPVAAFAPGSDSGLRPPFTVVKRVEADLWLAEARRVAKVPLASLSRPVGPLQTSSLPPGPGRVSDVVVIGQQVWVLTSDRHNGGPLFRLEGERLSAESEAGAAGMTARCMAAALDEVWLCSDTGVRARSMGWKFFPALATPRGFTRIAGSAEVMWLGSQRGVWRKLSKAAQAERVFPADDARLNVTDLRIYKERLWVLTEKGGLLRHDPDVGMRMQVEGLNLFGRVINLNNEVGVRRVWYARDGKAAYRESPGGRFKVLLARSAATLQDRLEKGDAHDSLDTARMPTSGPLSFKIHASVEDEFGNREVLRSRRIITAPIRTAVLFYLAACLALVVVAPLWRGFLYPVAGRQMPAVLFPVAFLTGIGWIRRLLLNRYWSNRRAAAASWRCSGRAIEQARAASGRIRGPKGRKLLRLVATDPGEALHAVEDELLGPRSIAWCATSGAIVARTLWIGLWARRPLALRAEDLSGDPKDLLSGLEKTVRARLRGDGGILNEELAERMLVSGDLVLLVSRDDLDGGGRKVLEQFLRSLGNGTRVVVAGREFSAGEWEDIGYEVEDLGPP